MLAAVPADSKGTLTDKDARWIVRDVQAGYGSPVVGRRAHLPGRQRRHPVRVRRRRPASSCGPRSSARSRSRRRCWPTASCTSARRTASSTSSGRTPDKARGPRQRSARHARSNPEAIIASPAVARGRVYVVVDGRDVCARPEEAPARGAAAGPQRRRGAAAGSRAGRRRRCWSRRPTLILKPGEAVALTVRAFDAKGRPVAAPARRRGRSRT